MEFLERSGVSEEQGQCFPIMERSRAEEEDRLEMNLEPEVCFNFICKTHIYLYKIHI
jgi:hypothetical protein